MESRLYPLFLSQDHVSRYGQTDQVNDDNHYQHRLNSYGSNHICAGISKGLWMVEPRGFEPLTS